MVIVGSMMVLVYVCCIWLPRLLVATLALILAINLSLYARRMTRLMLQNTRRDLDYDRKPSRAERRLMRASLRLAIRQTELRSLFPSVMAQAEGIVS